MKKIKCILSVLFLVLFTLVFVLVIPIKGIYHTEVSNNKSGHEMPIPSMAYGYQISQELCPSNDHIDSILLWISSLKCDTSQGYLKINLLDSDMNIVYENSIFLYELPSYGWFEAVRDIDVTANATYYLTLETIDAIDDGPVISYYRSDNAQSQEEEDGQLTYAYLPLDDCALKIRIIYNVNLSLPEYFAYYVFILFIAAFISSYTLKTKFSTNLAE